MMKPITFYANLKIKTNTHHPGSSITLSNLQMNLFQLKQFTTGQLEHVLQPISSTRIAAHLQLCARHLIFK